MTTGSKSKPNLDPKESNPPSLLNPPYHLSLLGLEQCWPRGISMKVGLQGNGCEYQGNKKTMVGQLSLSFLIT